jgi:thimet oligopeptidase
MVRRRKAFFLLSFFSILITCCSYQGTFTSFEIPKVETVAGINLLFPRNASGIKTMVEQAIKEAQQNLDKIYAVADAQRTFENTPKMHDRAVTSFGIKTAILQALELLSPDNDIRTAAHDGSIELTNYYIDNFTQNARLYKAMKAYGELPEIAQLNEQEDYYYTNTMQDFSHSGLGEDKQTQDELKVLKKELAVHEINFEKNIAQTNKTVVASKEDLSGLSQDWIDSLKKTEDGKYILRVDKPTFAYVMSNCSSERTRKALWFEMMNIAYPDNLSELKHIVKLRDIVARKVGFASFAALDIDAQMADSVETVEKFLNNIVEKGEEKVNLEMETYKKDLPAGVVLENGQFKPWDMRYVSNYYKKKYLFVDESALKEYFPLEHTLEALFDIYQTFFGIELKKEEQAKVWHPEVITLSVYKDGKHIGYILLDLFPRDNKFNHAAHASIVPTFMPNENDFYPAVSIVMTNFPKPTAQAPALLLRADVVTFFHEFGHALHALLGATQLGTVAGTSVKTDFVEMPSQMLEEWMWQPEILKKVSQHYQTKEPLSDEMIDRIVALKNYNIGEHIRTQVFLAFLSLNLFKEGAEKNIQAIFKSLYKMLMNHVKFIPEDNFYASFGHLDPYAAKYYGYLWSEVYADDLFDEIKKAQFSPAIGKKYVDTILSKGGSADPMDLLRDFLGRDPNDQAFFKNLGFTEAVK